MRLGYNPSEHNVEIPVEHLVTGALVWSSGYLFEVVSLAPVFDTCVGLRRQFEGRAVYAPNGNGYPPGGYKEGTYSTGRNGMAYCFVGPRELVQTPTL